MTPFSHGPSGARQRAGPALSQAAPSVSGMPTRTTTRRAAGFRCSECGWSAVKWVGRCGECQAWGSVTEVGEAPARTTAATAVTPAPPIGEVDLTRAAARATGVGEFDRVLGGGLVPG